jgi:outer membrane protein assembly factor BamB
MNELRTLVAAVSVAAVLALPLAAGDWPQFRGPERDARSSATGLLREWPEGGPQQLWSVEACEGYAGAAIVGGKVYFNDYDREANTWLVRCLALADGEELWRFTEKRKIRPNHGITRTVPAVDGELVFSFDPKCVLHCLDAETGEELWRKSMVADYGGRIPSWYNGQCPLLEPDRVLVAPGGEALVVALEKRTGEELWRTPNPDQRKMSHASLMPAELGGVRQYLYCTLEGPLGISAEDGSVLWQFPYKFNVAVAPSPLAVDGERVFLTAGYDAGSVMIRVRRDGEAFAVEELFRLSTAEWNSEVQTPIVHEGHIFGVGKRRRGLFTCLDLDGKVVWNSTGEASFELGGFILADGVFLAMEGTTGVLRMIEASTSGYSELASAEVLSGPDVWGPPALSDGKLVVRDMTRMVCLQVGAEEEAR